MIEATIRTLRGNQVLRFLLAGAINTLFGFLVYTAAIVIGAAVWLALLAGIVCGMIFNFFSTGGYVFRELGWGRVPRFVLCYFLVYLSNLKLIEWLLPWVGNAILAQAILTLPIAALTYVLMARFVFFRKPPA
jgi:putative flippase GtrA